MVTEESLEKAWRRFGEHPESHHVHAILTTNARVELLQRGQHMLHKHKQYKFEATTWARAPSNHTDIGGSMLDTKQISCRRMTDTTNRVMP